MQADRGSRLARTIARPAGGLAAGLAGLAALAVLAAAPAAAQNGSRLQERFPDAAQRLAHARQSLRASSGGVINLMGYNVVPDGSANAMQINQTTVSGREGDPTLTLSQFGFGFTVSESFPLFVETYMGYARYDPRLLFDSDEPGSSPSRWNNFTATLGIGYDVPIAENLWLRPIVNVAAGYAASDISLLGSFVEYRRDADLTALTDRHVNAFGYGGSLMLAYYNYGPERAIETELRYTRIQLQTVGDTVAAARGHSTAETAGIWARYRWPTGREAFGRPIRWVIDGSASYYLGDQRQALNFAWSAKVGGGVEVDVGRWELGALGLSVSTVRLVARYFFADDNVTGTSISLGMSF